MFRKIPLILSCIVVLSLLYTAVLVQTQEDPPLPLPDNNATATPGADGYPADIPQEILDEQQAEAEAAVADILNRDIHNYRVAYFVSADVVEEDSVLSIRNVMDVTGAVAINDWDSFVTLNDELPFQMVLVHDSVYDQVDIEWIQNAYRNDVIIVGLNIGFDRYAEMVGDACNEPVNPGYRLESTNSWLYFIYNVITEDQEVRERVNTATLEKCEELRDINVPTWVSHGSHAEEKLDTQEDLDLLITEILYDTYNYRIPISTTER